MSVILEVPSAPEIAQLGQHASFNCHVDLGVTRLPSSAATFFVACAEPKIESCVGHEGISRFVQAKAAIPQSLRGFVTSYGVREYQEMGTRLFLAENGLGGYGITNGELINLFSLPAMRIGKALLKHALEQGAMRLSCFDVQQSNLNLPQYYAKFGFREVSRIGWCDQRAPASWDSNFWGKPDVVFMELEGVKH